MIKAESAMRHKWLVILLVGAALYVVWHNWPAGPLDNPPNPDGHCLTNQVPEPQK